MKHEYLILIWAASLTFTLIFGLENKTVVQIQLAPIVLLLMANVHFFAEMKPPKKCAKFVAYIFVAKIVRFTDTSCDADSCFED